MRDVVYILKNDINSEEIRYSLRSVEENFPHRKVFFFGGRPPMINPDVMVPIHQFGMNKWEKVRNSLIKVCENDEVTDDFFLFNDDFYILKPVDTENFINFSDGDLEGRAKEIIHRYGKGSQYTTQLLQTATFLKAHGKQSKSFVLHLPMLINKQKALEVLTMKGMPPMFRSLYANMAEIPFETRKDVKIYTNDLTPGEDWDYLSTTDESFRDGEVGKWIRARFPNPSRFEKIQASTHDMYTEEGDDTY